MNSGQFNNLLSDISSQDTTWRDLAQKCADYYDHLQVTQNRLNQLRECETLDLIGNHIQPVVNSVLGHEEQTRVDWMVSADDNDSEEVSEALNQKLNEAMRLSEANRYCSEAYKNQIIKGVGWIGMRKNPDPFEANKYIIERIPVDEMFWDMRSRDASLRDCRWMARRKFVDIDEAYTAFPDQRELIRAMSQGDYGTGFEVGENANDMAERYSEYQIGMNFSEQIFESISGSARPRIAIYEVYYRDFKKVSVLTFANGRVEEFDKTNRIHTIALIMGKAKHSYHKITKMRRKFFIGPHEISDSQSPHPHNYFPYVMFQGYVEDGRNTPYGIVRGMIDPQDSYNESGFEIMKILQNIRITKEEGATSLRDSDLVSEVRRRDSVITVKEGKLGSIIIEREWNKLKALNGLQEKYAQQIRDYSGVYNSYSGREAKQNSGVAIASLAELGATTLSEINANYQYARKKLGELMLAHIVNDIGDNTVTVGIMDGKTIKKEVVLNYSNNGKIDNAVARARMQVVLADVHSSAGYRQHLNRRIMEMYQVQGVDPVMRGFMMEMAIETSELPNRAEYIEKLKKLRGESDDPDAQKKMQELQAQQMQIKSNLEMRREEAEIRKINMEANRSQAMVNKLQVAASKEVYEIERLKADAEAQENAEKKVLIDLAWKNQAKNELAIYD